MPVSIGGSGPITGVTSINTTVTDTELGYLDGVTSAIQTQLNGKMTSTAGTWAYYTPTLTSNGTQPNLGSTGTITGRYTVIGNTVLAAGSLVFSGTGISAGTGNYYLGLPVAISGLVQAHGTIWMFRNTTGAGLLAFAADANSTTTIAMYSGNNTTISIGAANPWSWGSGDQIRWNLTYEKA